MEVLLTQFDIVLKVNQTYCSVAPVQYGFVNKLNQFVG